EQLQVVQATQHLAAAPPAGLAQAPVVGDDRQLPRRPLLPDEPLDEVVSRAALAEQHQDAAVVLPGGGAGRGVGGVEDDGQKGPVVGAVQAADLVEQVAAGGLQPPGPGAGAHQVQGVGQVVAVDQVAHGAPSRVGGTPSIVSAG